MRAKVVHDALEVGQYPYGDDDTSGRVGYFQFLSMVCVVPPCVLVVERR